MTEKKKILYIPQLATIDKITNKIIINADSNIVIMNNIITNLHQYYDFFVIMPREDLCNISFNEAISDKIHLIVESTSKNMNAFSIRYDFDFEYYYRTIKNIKPDYIINNTSTITKNIRVILHLLQSNCKLINFLHFLDLPDENKVPKDVSYFLRQVEGVDTADLAVFQSETVKKKFHTGIKKYNMYNLFPLKSFRSKYCVWNSTYSQTEIDRYQNVIYNITEKKRIIFPNRLSSTNYSNHLRFFEAIRNISKQRNDFEVIINNPTQYLSNNDIRLECPNVVIHDHLLSRKEYYQLLHSCDIGVALFTQEGHGGVSSKEFQAAECLPVYPKCNEYAELMPKDYKGYCSVDLHDLEQSLNYVLNIARTDVAKYLTQIGKRLVYYRDSFESNVLKIKKDLEKLS